jgi:hypothetical protein
MMYYDLNFGRKAVGQGRHAATRGAWEARRSSCSGLRLVDRRYFPWKVYVFPKEVFEKQIIQCLGWNGTRMDIRFTTDDNSIVFQSGRRNIRNFASSRYEASIDEHPDVRRQMSRRWCR